MFLLFNSAQPLFSQHRQAPPDSSAAQQTHSSEQPNDHHGSALSDQPIPLKLHDFPARPRPILEIGENFLGTGNLHQGFTLPTGAVWQPYFMLFGTYRSGLQSTGNPGRTDADWSNRFDLFGNLYLTFTERILIGFRPLDREGRFTGLDLSSGRESGSDNFTDATNFRLQTLFFEGDFGELFPGLDPKDKHGLDFGISVGRQLISFQEGMLINDIIDAIGITKINVKLPTTVNFRYTLLYGWNQIHRTGASGGNREDNDAWLLAFLTETDWRSSTFAFDAIYINSSAGMGDGLHFGLSSVQRMGEINTSFRALASLPVGDETPQNRRGALLFSEVSLTPHGTHNFAYFNLFWGIDHFRSAARDPSAAGALAPRAGILFSAPGLGGYGAALGNNAADEAVGGAIGYQMFFAHTRRQLLLELGGRYSTTARDPHLLALGGLYQIAFGRRNVIRLDAFVSYENMRSQPALDDRIRFGGRLEYLLRL